MARVLIRAMVEAGYGRDNHGKIEEALYEYDEDTLIMSNVGHDCLVGRFNSLSDAEYFIVNRLSGVILEVEADGYTISKSST